jgi:hypothetical protein
MKRLTFFLLFIFSSINYFGQTNSNQNKELHFGKYKIGYKDTIVFDSTEMFSFQNYNGFKPYFIHIWYPTVSASLLKKINYEDYWNFNTSIEYESIINQLRVLYNNQTFGVSETPEIIKNQPLDVYYKPLLLKKKLPVILYHHGSQGIGIENNKLCEYFASHGYLVISPYFTLPSDIVPKLIPSSAFKNKFDLSKLDSVMLNQIEKEMDKAEFINIDFILKFIKHLPSTNGEIYGIGHSHGAQRLFLSDRDTVNSFKKILAMHTLYEEDNPDDLCSIRPLDCEKMNNVKHFTTPKFFIAPNFIKNERILRPDFTFHKKIPRSTFIELNSVIEHNAFVYDWLLNAINEGITPKNRSKDYFEILEICLEIIEGNHLKSDSFKTISHN